MPRSPPTTDWIMPLLKAWPPPPLGGLPFTVCVLGMGTVADAPVPMFKVRAYLPVPNAVVSAPATFT